MGHLGMRRGHTQQSPGRQALEGPRGILTRLAVFYYWAGAKLPSALGDALLRSRLIVRVMSVSMAKTKDAELRRFVHDQHDTYFSRNGSKRYCDTGNCGNRMNVNAYRARRAREIA